MKDPQDALVSMLCDDNRRMREAGCSLAMAAMQVIRDSDGLHRLALAVSAWADAIAKEGGRPHGNDVGHNTVLGGDRLNRPPNPTT